MAKAFAQINPAGNPGIFARILNGIGRGFVAMTESNSRLKAVRALQSKSDGELADMGLKREDIVHKVFGDTYYL